MASMRSNVIEPPIGTIAALFQLKCRAGGLTYPRHPAPGPWRHGGRLGHRHLRRGLADPHAAVGEAGYGVRVGDRCNPGADAPCDLVILSVYMPKQAGAQCVRSVQETHPDTPVIAISGQFRPGLSADG